MSGAPNCQNPVWSPEEKAIISAAWSVKEAWESHLIETAKRYFPEEFGYTKTHIPGRSFAAIKREWERVHPKTGVPNTPLERELEIALNELEAMVS
jgi:hypothetical protein